ncbi:MAG: DsrE family protein [Pirellulales bacterium]|nr:DsrE family protein [Thermoguttaceae bacterium]MDD4787005.1 DsrE family protein [Pirellulales bacterium]MDI9446103.1 DsrE family protein [Planctomycetota bacterium]
MKRSRATACPTKNWVQMTKDLIADGVTVKVCGTCQARCGIRKGDPYYQGAHKSTMPQLSPWVRESEQVLAFRG